jgi:alpha-D-ribose 1-methylphosphonate 5-triphosphate diphosphatase
MTDRPDFAVRNVHAVLPDCVLDDAVVVVRDGVIVDVAHGSTAPADALDGRGAFCLPGLIDTHSDGLEKELVPRPGVVLPVPFALRSFEARVRSAGVTTVFHGVGFEDDDNYGRTVVLANELCDAIEERATSGAAVIDHHILYRLDARDAPGFDGLVARLAERLGTFEVPPLVSFEDHTPGIGQYTDRTAFERYIAGTRNVSEDEARRRVDDLVAERDALLVNRDRALPWLTHQVAQGYLMLMAHDPATDHDVAEAVAWGSRIAEFPTTVRAAELATEAGLRTVCGAPNVLRGRSHSGNVSASELIALGLCDGLASDYLPTTLLGAVAALVDRGVCDLPQAVAQVTSGPADTVGLFDRGRLVPGQRGDLVLVTFDGSLPTVRAVLRPDLRQLDRVGVA